jgi:hypothetical protein
MTPRTATPPLQDRSMWRKLLRTVHPDTYGAVGLFVWCPALYEHVAGDAIEPPRREPPRQSPRTENADRIPFSHRFASFTELTEHAVAMAQEVPQPFARLLAKLADCLEVGPEDPTLYRAQRVGATYKQMALIAHMSGMSKAERVRWYRVGEGVSLAQAHAGLLLKRLQEEPAAT